jgi:hypothetical protein
MKVTHPGDAADFVHEESTDIAQMALDSAILGKYDIIYDETMKNKEKYERLIARLREAGYEVFAIIVDVPLEAARVGPGWEGSWAG